MTHTSKPSTTVRQSLRAEVERERTRQGCRDLEDFLASADEADRAEWLEVLADTQIQTAQIHRVLKKRGIIFSYSTVARHRDRLRQDA